MYVSSKLYLFFTYFVLGVNLFAYSADLPKDIAKDAKVKTTGNIKKPVANPVGTPGAVNSALQLNIITPAKAVSKPILLIKSYKEWKNEKVQDAIKRITITKAQIEYKKLNKQVFQKTEATLGKDINIERLESQLKNDLFSLEVAQQLSVQDYFAIYLTKLDNRNEAFKEAAQKMNSEEIAELINAFADSLTNSQGNAVAPSASSNEIFEEKIK